MVAVTPLAVESMISVSRLGLEKVEVSSRDGVVGFVLDGDG